MTAFIAADTSYGGFKLLRETRYTSAAAQIPDDGIIDDVAVERFLAGDNVRLTGREVVCVVAEAARRGWNDWRIAARFGRDNADGARWAWKLRYDNRIASVDEPIELWPAVA